MSKRFRLTLPITLLALFTVTASARAGLDDGMEAYNLGKYTQAMDLLTPVAESGNIKCQMVLAFMYETGMGVPVDNRLAAKWYQRAAEAGSAEAANKVGYLFERGGNGLHRDYAAALHWYKKAAESGWSEAKYHLGRLYENGIGVCRDLDQALKWYKEAAGENIAEAGDSFARLTHRGTPL